MRAKKAINNPEGYLKDIRRKTRRLFTAEQKILIVMEALRAETSIAELCRKHGIQESTVDLFFYSKYKIIFANSDYFSFSMIFQV